MTTKLPADYAERVYAGVLGKVIGVYLGRPFEGWSYDMIQQRLGDVEYYVHDKLNVPLIVTDDDISGTFTFLRSLADNHVKADISAREIGASWLNYIIENRSILWWGGLGNSTEHTAFIRLKNGIDAPTSGSAETNGQVVSEQIGAQIFIDGWAMVAPGDPDQAAKFAEAAARVSHDGEAVYGAIVIAVMESMAFVESDIQELINRALTYIPPGSVISRLIDDVRSWHARDDDWRATRELLEQHYGYDKYGGNCHMVPNHGLIMHSLLHGQDDFSETLAIINTCGWDTDCNSGNVGCLMGIKNGLAGIDAGLEKGCDWRSPVADRIYLPTAEGGRGISDCVFEAQQIINLGRTLAGEAAWQPKEDALFHFEFPGAVQGFTVTEGDGEVSNVSGSSLSGERCLKIFSKNAVLCGTPVFVPSKKEAKYFEDRGYALMACPRLYPGQTVQARVIAGPENSQSTIVSLYVRYYGEDDEVVTVNGEATHLDPAEDTLLRYQVPALTGPLFEVGLDIHPATGKADPATDCDPYTVVLLDYLSWRGEPDIRLTKPAHKGTMWRRAWVNAVDRFDSRVEPYRLIQDQGTGLLIQGCRSWQNYRVTADITPHLAKRAGIAARVQGLKRYYALLLAADNKLQLVRMLNKEVILAECNFSWQFGKTYELELSVNDSRVEGKVDGLSLLTHVDSNPDLGDGSVALVIDEGRTATHVVTVSPQ